MTPRLKPIAGAELAPVMAASQPMRIGSDCAIAGRGKPSAAAPAAAVVPNVNVRRVSTMSSSRVAEFLLGVFAWPLSHRLLLFPQLGNMRPVKCEAPPRALGHE